MRHDADECRPRINPNWWRHSAGVPLLNLKGVAPTRYLKACTDFELIAATIATRAGKAKHPNPTQKYMAAAAAHPTANHAIPRMVRTNHAFAAARSPPASSLHRSTK